MVDVGVWQPDDVPLNAATLVRLSEAADSLEKPDLGLSPHERETWGQLMKLPADVWSPLLVATSDESLIRIAKSLTVAEMRDGVARSPVIAIVRELRRRGSYPKELTVWIKAHTTNRFLPYGSLADRL